MDFDDFDDDLDSLLDLESNLAEAGNHIKRSLADLQSQRDAAACLAGAPDGKRAKIDAPPPHRPRPLPAGDLDGELLAFAAGSQPSVAHAGNGASYRTFTTTATGLPQGNAQRHQQQRQPSQPVTCGGSSVLGQAPQRTAATSTYVGSGGGGAYADDDEIGLDAMLDDFLDSEQQGNPTAAHQAAATPCGKPSSAQPGIAVAADQEHQQTPAAAAAAEAPAAAPAAAVQQAEPEFVLPRKQYVPPAKEVYRISGASLAITSESGERVYCQLEAAQPPSSTVGATRSKGLDVIGMLRRARGGLLSDPISTLLAAVEQDQYDRAVAETAAAATKAAAAAAAGQQPRDTSNSSGGAAGRSGSALWVQKYAPKGYIELLSDEQINREVVRWLKGWDACAFGSSSSDAAPQRAQHGQQGGFNSRGGPGQQQQQGQNGSSPDPLGRPEHKIILIAGPPGLGKTTLAHVCAAHCGYRPVEINASDDRSGGSLQGKVLDAVEMQSVMGQRRPNCVIIDEIDGATGGAEGRSGIAALLKIVNATGSKGRAGTKAQQPQADPQAGSTDSDSDGEEAGGDAEEALPAGRNASTARQRRTSGGGSGNAHTAVRRGGGGGARPVRLRPLMRPIICICNDLYAPALRPLRDVARVFHFQKPQAERLAQRLRSICLAEGLACEKSTLRLLVERTECDIRSCLNTLQFLAKKQSSVRQADLQGLRVGQKDMTKGAFAMWTELLQKKKSPGIIGKMVESEGQRVARLYGALQDFGEADLVMGGMHENVLGLRYFDMALQRTSGVLNHLGDADTFLRACHRRGEFALLKYVPAPLLLVSGAVAGPDRPQLQWPRAALDSQRRAAANAATLQAWMLGMAPATCAATSRRSMVLEVLPALMHITAPALRPVSQHLYSPVEQETMRQLVDTLLGYNLRYCLDPAAEEAEEAAAAAAAELQQQQGGGGGADGDQRQRVRGGRSEPAMRFRPAVHCACHFPGMATQGRLLPAAVRQTVSHEADMEAIRRAEATRRGSGGSGSGNSPLQGAAGNTTVAPLADINQAPQRVVPFVPLTLAERMKAAGTAANVVRRQAATASNGTWLDALKERRGASGGGNNGGEGGAAGASRHHKFPVLYRFHEGYTNAVKRPVLMSDLLG